MPLIWDKREIMMNQLVTRGDASMGELLTATFGEWPPKGLDINPDVRHDQKIEFKPLSESVRDNQKSLFSNAWNAMRETANWGGAATLQGDRNIYLNKVSHLLPRLFGISNLRTIMAHETTHILQGDNSYRAAQIYGKTGAEQLESGIVSNKFMNDVKIHNEEHAKENRLTSAFNKVSNILTPSNKKLDYLGRGIEIQARLQEVIAAGYPKWGKLPQNRDELWMAMSFSGIQPPEDIQKHLKGLPKDSGAQVFAKINDAGTPSAGIGSVVRALNDEGKKAFWDHALPAIYSDLIEMYGDKQGRERFGFGPNQRGMVQQEVLGKNPKASAPKNDRPRI